MPAALHKRSFSFIVGTVFGIMISSFLFSSRIASNEIDPAVRPPHQPSVISARDDAPTYSLVRNPSPEKPWMQYHYVPSGMLDIDLYRNVLRHCPVYDFPSLPSAPKHYEDYGDRNQARILFEKHIEDEKNEKFYVKGWAATSQYLMVRELTKLQHSEGIFGSVGEIGVYKGRFYLFMALHAASFEPLFAVDQLLIDNIATEFFENLNKYSLKRADLTVYRESSLKYASEPLLVGGKDEDGKTTSIPKADAMTHNVCFPTYTSRLAIYGLGGSSAMTSPPINSWVLMKPPFFSLSTQGSSTWV